MFLMRCGWLAAAWLGTAQPAWAGTCALCREALRSAGQQGLIHGFYWSILLIAGVPLLILSLAGWLCWRHRAALLESHDSTNASS